MTDQLLNGSRPYGKIAILVNITGFLDGKSINIITTLNAIFKTKSCKIKFNTVIHVVNIPINYEYKFFVL